MAIDFPASPSTNDTFTAGSITYKWDGAKWIGLGLTPADRLVEGSNSLEITAGNDLVWTGDRVGLGTASPTQKFDVRGSIYVGDNIGINDTSPDNKLHITTTSSSSYSTSTTNTSNLTNALLKLQNLDGSDGTGANNYVGIQFSVANGATSTAQMQYVRTGDNAGKFEFKARNTSTSYPNIMTLLSSGEVGIGTVSPTNTHGKGLHIADTNAGIRIQNTVDTGWAYVEYADESNSVKYTQGYRDVSGLYSIRPGNSLASADSGLEIQADGTTQTDWFTCAHTGKTVNASDTAVLTINGYNPTFVQVYIKANFAANGALQAHFDYELITCDAQGTGGTTTIRQSLNESVGAFQISTSDFAVTKSGQNVIITYTNQNAGQNQISFYVKGLFNNLSLT